MAQPKRAAEILAAAEHWKRHSLLDGLSLFGEEEIWTSEYFEALKKYYVERPDAGSGSFEEKLRTQLEPAPPEAKRLWAEITWLYFLIATSLKRVTKLDRIRSSFESSGVRLPEGHWALGSVLENGIVDPGAGYLVHQWRECRFIIALMLDWSRRSRRDRESLLQDPWSFATWVDRHNQHGNRQFRHVLVFLLFPDQFAPIVSPAHKKAIVRAFREKSGRILDTKRMDLIQIDRELLAISQELHDGSPGQEINYYASPYREVWKSGSPQSNSDSTDAGAGVDNWYRARFGEADIWTIAPGQGARLWEEFLELGIVAIGWDHLGDLSEYESRDAIHSALIEHGDGKNPFNQSLAAWEFVHEIKIGDVLLAKRGRGEILGWGRVTGEYAADSERAEYQNTRTVDWKPSRTPIVLSDPITTKTLTRFTAYKDWLRRVFESLDADLDERETEPKKPEPEPYGVATAIRDLFLEEAQFRRILDSLALRKNLVLQGPPGVGKTFIARRIAWSLLGKKDSEFVEMVQFHQSYAYEDFVQGWRPTEKGGFALRNGVFVEFCDRARKDTHNRPFVFIIDEINRGNLSRIFGELLMLIEADKRGKEHEIPLTYGKPGTRFSVPENLYLIGLMNTADRSLAIVDYALRRRFAFETLRPAYGTQKFRDHLLEAEVALDLVDKIEEHLLQLNRKIRQDKDLGPGFEIGHSYFVPEESADEAWYVHVVETQIAPLLREYWFDRPEEVERVVKKLRA